MEDVLAILLIFGGGTLIVLSFSPVGKAWADRIRHGKAVPAVGEGVDHEVYEELDRLRAEVNELHERVDFTERMLAKGVEETPAKENG